MSHILAIIAAVVIPVFAFWLNWMARTNQNYQLSAAADFALAIAVFDFGALAARDVFQDQIAPQVRPDFGMLFLIYALGTSIAWGWLFLRWEDKMDLLYKAPVTVNNTIQSLFIRSWIVVGVIVTVHVLTFLYR